MSDFVANKDGGMDEDNGQAPAAPEVPATAPEQTETPAAEPETAAAPENAPEGDAPASDDAEPGDGSEE